MVLRTDTDEIIIMLFYTESQGLIVCVDVAGESRKICQPLYFLKSCFLCDCIVKSNLFLLSKLKFYVEA